MKQMKRFIALLLMAVLTLSLSMTAYAKKDDDDEEQYYSVRLHCSEKDFDEEAYHSTMGIIDQDCGNALVAIKAVMRHISERGLAAGLEGVSS